MSQMDDALEQAGRFLTEPHAVVVRPGDGDTDGPEDNPRAAAVLGKRADDVPTDSAGVLSIDMPVELGYHCPVCVYDNVVDGEFDERLMWSEYRAMLWCYVCERDYPSALCLPDDPARATEVFLDSLTEAVALRSAELQHRGARWAHELSEADRVLTSLGGEQEADLVGEPLPQRIAQVFGATFGAGFVAGERSLAERTTADVLARAIYPASGGRGVTEARAVRTRLASELRWPE